MNFDHYVARIVPDSVQCDRILLSSAIVYYRSDAVQWDIAYLFVVTDLVPTVAIYQFDDGRLLFFSPIQQYEFDILDAFGVPHLNGDDIQRTFVIARPQIQIREDATSMNWTGDMTFHERAKVTT